MLEWKLEWKEMLENHRLVSLCMLTCVCVCVHRPHTLCGNDWCTTKLLRSLFNCSQVHSPNLHHVHAR